MRMRERGSIYSLEVSWESGDADGIQRESPPPSTLLLPPSVKYKRLHTPHVGYLPPEQDEVVPWKSWAGQPNLGQPACDSSILR
jgi:hypothetical protein